VAETDGIVIPPPAIPAKESPDGRLPRWDGTPLDHRNLNATLSPGTLFCQVGDPTKFEAILVIDQADIEMIRTGQKVEMMLDELPGLVVDGKITAISPEELQVAPRQLASEAGGPLTTKTDESGVS